MLKCDRIIVVPLSHQHTSLKVKPTQIQCRMPPYSSFESVFFKAFVSLPKLKHILDNRTAPHILKTSYITGHIRSLSQTRSLKGSLCFLVSPGLGHMPVYFSNLPGSVRSRVRMFAYDTDVYLKLKSQTSAQCI